MRGAAPKRFWSLRGAGRLRERGVLSAGVPLPNASVTALYPGNTEAERAAARRTAGDEDLMSRSTKIPIS